MTVELLFFTLLCVLDAGNLCISFRRTRGAFVGKPDTIVSQP